MKKLFALLPLLLIGVASPALALNPYSCSPLPAGFIRDGVTSCGYILAVNSDGSLNVVVSSGALPTGAATAANQTSVQAPVTPATATATKSVLSGVQAIASGTSTMTAGQQGFQPVDLFGSTPVLNKDASGVAIDYTTNISINPYPGGSTAITGNATGSTGAVVGTLSGTSGKTTYICGFTADAVGGTATIGPITVAGLVGSSMVFYLSSSAAGSHLPNPFGPVCVPASATNTAITVTTTADGTATAVAVNSWGFQL